MAAPIKKNATSTSASRFMLLVVGISLLALTLFGAAKLQRSHILRPASQPQVQGSSTQNEYVPQQDVVAPTVPSPDNANEPYLVTAVSDGDTIKVRIGNKTETVRFIGVDTPETKDPRKPVQCFGKEAASYTSTALLNKNVTLLPDPSQQNRDTYGRLLRYVYLNGELFNQTLIETGFGYEYTYKTPYQFQAAFKAAQKQAEASKIGLWNSTTCAGVR